MTQNRPPTPPGPAPEESLSARFAGRTPDELEHVEHVEHVQHGFEDQPGTVSETEHTNEAGGFAGEAPDQTGPAADEEVQAEPLRAEADDGAAEHPVEDERSQEDLVAALKAAEAVRDEYLEDLRRTQAEFQNFRKRTMREGVLQREQGMIEVLSRLIDVVDDFELAVLAADSAREVGSLRKGIEMVYGKFVEVLQSFGLEKIGQEGVPFDPQQHDAVQRVEDGEERGEPVVAEVLRPGYLVGGRVLRPAMVKVVT